MAGEQGWRSGTFACGMDFASWGSGPRSLLFLPGGPGSSVPRGLWARMAFRWFEPFVDAGYTIWYVTRPRHLPAGHTVADMADDLAAVIVDELGGRVDLVVGESYGGMIALLLAARGGHHVGRVAVVVAAAEVSEWGRQVDARLAGAVTRGDTAGVGTTFAEYAMPGDGRRWLRKVVGPFLGRSLMSGKSYPPSDLLVEAQAEIGFRAWEALPEITVPVVLVSAELDRFFPPDVVDETVRLIPDCTPVRYAGRGHMQVASDRRVAHDILTFVDGD
ncbi:alpha/beta fold hydrolase [Terrabacter sp. AAH1]